MNPTRFAIYALAITLLSACATSRTMEEELAAGATLQPPNSLEAIGDDGFTMTSTEDRWIVYFGPDGRKVVLPTGKPAVKLGWRIDGQGRFCDQYAGEEGKQDGEACDRQILRIRNSDGIWTDWEDGKPLTYRYRVTRGNPKGL